MLTILKHFLLTGIDGRKAIRRIAQPQPEGLRSSGLGAAPQQAEKPFVLWKRNGWFFAFVLQVHCLPVLYQIGYKSSKQCIWRAICETPRFHGSGSEGFLLVEAPPQAPVNAIFQIAATRFFQIAAITYFVCVSTFTPEQDSKSTRISMDVLPTIY